MGLLVSLPPGEPENGHFRTRVLIKDASPKFGFAAGAAADATATATAALAAAAAAAASATAAAAAAASTRRMFINPGDY